MSLVIVNSLKITESPELDDFSRTLNEYQGTLKRGDHSEDTLIFSGGFYKISAMSARGVDFGSEGYFIQLIQQFFNSLAQSYKSIYIIPSDYELNGKDVHCNTLEDYKVFFEMTICPKIIIPRPGELATFEEFDIIFGIDCAGNNDNTRLLNGQILDYNQNPEIPLVVFIGCNSDSYCQAFLGLADLVITSYPFIVGKYYTRQRPQRSASWTSLDLEPNSMDGIVTLDLSLPTGDF